MKNTLFILLLLLTSTLYSQGLSGSYTSNNTTYTDIENPENSFKEETLFNLIIHIDNQNEGMLGIHDPRIPEKLLVYRIDNLLDTFEAEGRQVVIFQAVTEHLQQNKKTRIVFSTDKNNNLNLMIDDPESFQTFHALKVAEEP